MEIYWKKKGLRKKVQEQACSESALAKRLVQIGAAETFCDLVPSSAGGAHFLKGDRFGQFAIYFGRKGAGKRFICEPSGDYQQEANGQYVKESIREITILEVTDYH